jgi:hypothetical protein
MGLKSQSRAQRPGTLIYIVGAAGLLLLGIALLLSQAALVEAAPGTMGAALAGVAQVGFSPGGASAPTGQLVTLTVEVGEVEGLGSFIYRIDFDPTLLEVVDANPYRQGVQIYPAEIFEGRETTEYFHDVNNLAGIITYSVGIFGGGQGPVSGPGVLGRIVFEGKASGTSLLEFNYDTDMTVLTYLSIDEPWKTGLPIDSAWHDGFVIVDPLQLFIPLIVNE